MKPAFDRCCWWEVFEWEVVSQFLEGVRILKLDLRRAELRHRARHEELFVELQKHIIGCCSGRLLSIKGLLSTVTCVYLPSIDTGTSEGGVEDVLSGMAHLESDFLCWRQLCEEPAVYL